MQFITGQWTLDSNPSTFTVIPRASGKHKEPEPFTFWYCAYNFFPWKGTVGKKVLELRSIAELRAFHGILYTYIIADPGQQVQVWPTPCVADPDPRVFGPSESGPGSKSQRYGSGSGSFYHEAKIVRKPLISTVLWLLFDFFIFEKWCIRILKK
jgi:hypothetical protein